MMVNMNAQQIIKILKRIKNNRQESYRIYSDERYFSEMPYYNEIFALAEKIEPYNEVKTGRFFSGLIGEAMMNMSIILRNIL